MPRRRDRLIRERIHDSYRAREKLSEPSVCPDCGALFRSGRWQWGAATAVAAPHTCPACQRIADKYPAASLLMRGDFLAAHRDEILNAVRNEESRQKAMHPLKRIMSLQEDEGGTVVTTTDSQLARDIGEALKHAYAGELQLRYKKEEDFLRVTWER
jgi:NMD protein affecting ribosome stability and mRNA decay